MKIPVILCFLAITAGLCYAPANATADNPFQKDEVDAAIADGISYLMGEQVVQGRLSGAIIDGQNRSNRTAMTALAIMAMAAVGHQPTDPTPEGDTMRMALDFVLHPDNIQEDQYFGADGSRMYGHGIITLMLAEMLGMGIDDEQDALIRERLERAVALILASQRVRKGYKHLGGWRYTPKTKESDLSVSVWQVMALRSAKNAGLPVPKESIDLAIEYIRRCYHDGQGGFGYQPGRPPDYAMVAAGVLSMQVCGAYDAEEVLTAADWLHQRELDSNKNWFFYGSYYYAQGMYQRGGRYSDRARGRVEDLMLRIQHDGGYWAAVGGQERSAGRIYATSMAILSLSVKYHYLPIYQR